MSPLKLREAVASPGPAKLRLGGQTRNNGEDSAYTRRQSWEGNGQSTALEQSR